MALPYKLEYLFNLFGPLSFLSFLNPVILLVAIPNFLQHLFSLRQTETTLYYYYPCEILAFIFISAVFGLKFLLKFNITQKYKNLIYITIILVALSFTFQLGPQFDILPKIKERCLLSDDAIEKNKFIKMVPKGSSVISTFVFLPKLSTITDRLYSFHRVISEFGTPLDRRLLLPDDLEFALIDFNDSLTFSNFYQSVARHKYLMDFFEKSHWGLVKASNNTVFLKKGHIGDFNLYEAVYSAPDKNIKNVSFDNNIKLISYDLEKNVFEKKEGIHIVFFWQALGKIYKDYLLSFILADSNDVIRHSVVHPLCYRIYPASVWQENEIVKENCWFSIPSGVSSGKYKIYIGIIDPFTGKLCDIKSPGPKKETAWAELCDITVR